LVSCFKFVLLIHANLATGKWGGETVRKWVPAKISKKDVEAQDSANEVKLNLPTPVFSLKDMLKTSALEGPKTIF
jgi:hypothetical protein